MNVVSVKLASRHITSTSRYLPRYQSRSLMYIRGLIPRNFAELAEAVPIDFIPDKTEVCLTHMQKKMYSLCPFCGTQANTRRLIRVSTVCLHNFLLRFE